MWWCSSTLACGKAYDDQRQHIDAIIYFAIKNTDRSTCSSHNAPPSTRVNEHQHPSSSSSSSSSRSLHTPQYPTLWPVCPYRQCWRPHSHTPWARSQGLAQPHLHNAQNVERVNSARAQPKESMLTLQHYEGLANKLLVNRHMHAQGVTSDCSSTPRWSS